MLKLAKLFNKGASAKPLPRVPEGERFYVIGDIHGRCDLFDELILAIENDDRKAGDARSTVVMLGDLIDRGPCLLYTSPSPRDLSTSRMPSSA